MRALPLPLALAALLVAAPALAQERIGPADHDFRSYTVAEDVTLEAPAVLLPPAADALTGAGPDAEDEAAASAEAPADALVQEEIGSRRWLYLVAAIVAGGIILAVLL